MQKFFNRSLLINAALLAAMCAVGYGTIGVVRHALVLKGEADALWKKIDTLGAQKKILEARMSELRTTEAAEREAKERFNLKKPGEEVVVVVPSEPKKEENRTTTLPNFWERVRAFFW